MVTPNVGWRFSPKDEELINYFLARKINGKEDDVKVIREIDVCKWEPWDLPSQSVLKSDDKEWFFFCPRDQKFPSSSRLNRATRKGYWKTTGKDRTIRSKKNVIGMKKSLVFHTGRAPTSKRTYWVMHEYHTTSKELDGTRPGQRPFVLCRLFKKDDEFVQDAAENDAELPSPSHTPNEHSPINSHPALVSQQVVPFTGQECTENFSSAEKRNDVDPHADVIFNYDEVLADLDPNDMFLFDSTTPESMGSSSLIQHSTNSEFFVKESLRLDGNENELDQYTCNVLQSLLADSPDNSCEDQGNNLISIDDYEIPNDHMSPCHYDTPGMDIGSFWKSNTDEMELSRMVVEHEQHAFINDLPRTSNLPGFVSSRTSFQELDESQTRPEYQGGAFSGDSVLDYRVSSDNQVSSSHVNVSNPDQVRNSGIQIQRRQPQVGLAINNSDKQGIAQRRINLQANLRRILTHDFEQPDTYNKQVIPKGSTTLQADSGTEPDDEWSGFTHDYAQPDAYYKHVLQNKGRAFQADEWRGFTHDFAQPDAYYKHVLQYGGTTLQADFGTEPDDEWIGFTHDSEQPDTYNEPVRMTLQGGYEPQAESRTESDDNQNVSKKFINENPMLIDGYIEQHGYCGTGSDNERHVSKRFIPRKQVYIPQSGSESQADSGTESDDEQNVSKRFIPKKQVYVRQSGSESQADSSTESDDNQNASKHFISSVISSFKPSQLSMSYKFMIGLTSVVTILIAYAGFRGYLSGR